LDRIGSVINGLSITKNPKMTPKSWI